MSKLRSVSTAFWSDPFIEELSPNEKLLFLYLITNEKTNMLGIYESSIKKIAFETGMNQNSITDALKKFESKNKVKYIDNFVILVNFMKHQNFNTNMMKSAIDIYNNLPNSLKDSNIIVDKNNPLEGFETLSKHFGILPKIEVEYEYELEGEHEVKKKTITDRKKDFSDSLKPYLEKYGKDMLNAFYIYWSETDRLKKKMKWEQQKTWELDLRLNKWYLNDFGQKKKDENPTRGNFTI